MKAILFVAIGGALGALARYMMGLWLKPEYDVAFPLHTFVINCVGCLLIGILFSYVVYSGPNQVVQFLLITGLLGGFTTFSSFTMETVYLFQQGESLRALWYVFLSNMLGLGSAWFGFSLVKWIV